MHYSDYSIMAFIIASPSNFVYDYGYSYVTVFLNLTFT